MLVVAHGPPSCILQFFVWTEPAISTPNRPLFVGISWVHVLAASIIAIDILAASLRLRIRLR